MEKPFKNTSTTLGEILVLYTITKNNKPITEMQLDEILELLEKQQIENNSLLNQQPTPLKNYNSTRHKYNPNTNPANFSRDVKYDLKSESNLSNEMETFDVMWTANTEKPKTAYKETEGKLFYELDWEFITQMAERMASNKKESKYQLFNWKNPMTPKGIDDLKQATLRHLLEVLQGRYEDDKREFGHLEAISDNMMMLNYQLKLNKS